MSEDERTTRWERLSSPVIADPTHALRQRIAAIRNKPRDPEARRQLHAIAAEQSSWDQLALMLADEARACEEKPELAVAFYEELVDVHENLEQPLETIAAMEHVVRLEPVVVAHRDRLAWLYRRAGAWQKAAEAFESVADLSDDDLARAALHAAGKLYRDNGRVDSAVASYRRVVTLKPSDLPALRALDELLAELGRWREVADVRGQLAARIETGVEKAALLRAQARALEQAGDQTGAASVVARAASHAPADVSGLVDYATVLARAGQGAEAATILEARVAEAIDRGAPTDDIAALRARLAGILEDACGDREAAAAVLETLLLDAPTYLPALERLVWHASHDPDPRVHAAALLRHAEAMPEGAERAGAFVEAARRLRDARDDRGAVRAYEVATELLPEDDAIRAELDDARTRLAVDTAATGARGGDAAGAERGLRQILRSHPLHVDANLALAELLAQSGRGDEAVAHLRDTLAAAPDGTPDAQLAPLVHRYSVAVGAAGDVDEAHKLLHEAHRLDRRAVPIKLALGESCFARRLWREAALHLGSLADHPDASKYASAVAAGLVHAAVAEGRALRPANAEKRYEAAVRIDATCAPAWHALGELAMGREDMVRAAMCLEREAHATTAPKDRLRLFDALGDLAATVLDDAERAERCWAQVADMATVPVLEKLLAAQRKRGATLERAETCERLAAISATPDAGKPYTAEAAEAFMAGGDLTRARAAAERVMQSHPLDEDAIASASAVMIAVRDYKRTATWLRRALGAWDAAGDRGAGDPRRAELWRRLGDAHRAVGEEQLALTAYHRAVEAAPKSEGALGARRGLVLLASATGREAKSSLFALVAADHDPRDVLAWARELSRAELSEDACAALELARALEAPLSSEDRAFETQHATRMMASDEAYGAALDDEERAQLIDDQFDPPVAELLELVAEAAALVCPDAKSALARAGLSDATRVSPVGASAAAAMYPQISNALRGAQTLLYATTNASRPQLELLLAMPPVIVLGPELANIRARSHADDGGTSDAAVRFALGRMVELARPRRVFAAGSGKLVLDELLGGLGVAFAGRTGSREVTAVGELLRTTLPVAVRRKLTERLAQLPADALDAGAYRAACQRAADRAGLLACGRVDVAVQLAGGPKAAPHLVALAATEGYLAARRKLRPRPRRSHRPTVTGV